MWTRGDPSETRLGSAALWELSRTRLDPAGFFWDSSGAVKDLRWVHLHPSVSGSVLDSRVWDGPSVLSQLEEVRSNESRF